MTWCVGSVWVGGEQALLNAIALLATPTAIMVGTVVFDKTGTLTQGEPGLVAFADTLKPKALDTFKTHAAWASVSSKSSNCWLWQDRECSSAEVKGRVQLHLEELEEKIAGLQAMHQTLSTLAQCCQGDARPDCPILDQLALGEADKARRAGS